MAAKAKMAILMLRLNLRWNGLNFSQPPQSPRRRDHKFGFEIVEIENIQDTEVEMPSKRLKIKRSVSEI